MKNIARLVLFFSLSFAVLFLTAVLLRFVALWIDFARFIPLEPKSGESITDAAWQALPVSIYITTLFALSYTARRNMPVFPGLSCIIVLGFILTLGVSLGINRADTLKAVLKPVSAVPANPGLILSRGNSAIILLKESGDVRGPRVVSIPGESLIYQELPLGPGNSVPSLPALAFGDTTPWFIRSIGIDFVLCAGELKSRLESDINAFAAYVFSLVLLLASLRFLLELSRWPLANIVLGALVFRGILALEVFLNTREINALIGSYLGARVPPDFITPLVFGVLGILVVFYTLLTGIIKTPGPKSRRPRDD